ncbi:MAG: RNA 3'-terminal phosphate cyclase [Bryobacteraceae bacterium]
MAALEIDGSFGEGGGQILRTSLALSLLTQKPFRIHNLRRGRAKPGLRRQHLTALRAAARIGNAQVEGDAVGSTKVAFVPAAMEGGNYEFDIGTAGSTSLVFQTVLPALMQCSKPSAVTFIGGTHNRGGPPWDFIETVFLPVLTRMGAAVNTKFERYGFVPAGGGRWAAEIRPSRLRPVNLHERAELRERSVRAIVSNLPAAIAERELSVVRQGLTWPDSAYQAETVESAGPGNVVMISGSFRLASELATGFGQRGVPAERVAEGALESWRNYDRAGVPVGEHLADQLLLPMAIAGGGSMLTTKPTLHTTTNAEVISMFLPIRFRMSPRNDQTWEISC